MVNHHVSQPFGKIFFTFAKHPKQIQDTCSPLFQGFPGPFCGVDLQFYGSNLPKIWGPIWVLGIKKYTQMLPTCTLHLPTLGSK